MTDPRQFGSHSCRDNSPDALFGGLLAVEAVLAALVSQAVAHGPAEQTSMRLLALRRQAESLAGGRLSTKYGTGEQEIADGVRDCLDAVFAKAGSASAPTVPTPSTLVERGPADRR